MSARGIETVERARRGRKEGGRGTDVLGQQAQDDARVDAARHGDDDLVALSDARVEREGRRAAGRGHADEGPALEARGRGAGRPGEAGGQGTAQGMVHLDGGAGKREVVASACGLEGRQTGELKACLPGQQRPVEQKGRATVRSERGRRRDGRTERARAEPRWRAGGGYAAARENVTFAA